MKKKTPSKKKTISNERPKKNTTVSAKGKDKNEEEPKEITLEYKLHELPSSQHKAGLAGLYLIIDWLHKQELPGKDILSKTEISESGLKVTLTKQDVRDLFDEIYKPILVDIESKSEPQDIEYTTYEKREKTTFYYYEIESKSIKKDKKLIREIEKEIADKKAGKLKKTKLYIYEEKLQEKKEVDDEEIEPIREENVEDVITYYVYKKKYPLGSFIYANDKSDGNAWVKIWREMQWILRGFKQQEPFKLRLENKNYCKDADEFWEVLAKNHKTINLSKVIFLSAQNNNAENIDFKEVTKNKLLLHFWLFVAQPYAYWTQRKDKNKYKTDEHGFIISIPDIGKLKSFIIVYNDLIRNQDREIKKNPIKRPEQAIVYFPKLAALLFLKNIHDLLKRRMNSDYSDVVYGIDLFHYDYERKNGKAIKKRASIFKGCTRIKPNIELENKAVNIKKLYKNFFFQKQLLKNLFEGRDELYDFYNLFCTREYEYFFNHWDGEFKPDAKTYFEEIKIKGEQYMEVEGKIPKAIETLVHQIVRTYVFSKLESKYQIIWDQEKKMLWSKSKNAPASDEDYKNKGKIAKDAFLAIRSRKDKEDFITYFTSTICSVSQRIGEEGYITLTESLYNPSEDIGWEKIRALSMLALSANS